MINEIQSVHKHVSIDYWSIIDQRSYQYDLTLFLQWPLQSTQKYNTEVWFQRSCTPAQVSLFIDPLFPLKRPLNVHKNIKAMRISWPLMEGGWGQGKKKIFFLFFSLFMLILTLCACQVMYIVKNKENIICAQDSSSWTISRIECLL